MNHMKMINLTPHAITVAGVTFPPSGQVARVSAGFSQSGTIGGIPTFCQTFGDVTGIPAPVTGVIYIVSAMVLSALAGTRNDLVAPATGHPGVVRNDQGQIVSVPGFIGGGGNELL